MQHPEHRLLEKAALHYRTLGWAVTPVRGKRAYLRGWPTRDLSVDQLRRELAHPDRGIGLVLGARSGDLVDVDLDCAQALEAAPQLLPPTPLIHGRPGRPSSHWWYKAPGTRSAAFRGRPEAGMLVEIRADGGAQTCVPPSRHPSGERLRWESWGEPAAVEAVALHEAVSRLAAAALLCSFEWRLLDALELVRDPKSARLATLRLPRAACSKLARWLHFDVHSPTPAVLPSNTACVLSGFSRAVFERVDVVGAGALLGLFLLPDTQQRCPFHCDRQASFQVSDSVWRCHAGCGAGNVIHLVALALRIDYRAARTWLAHRLDLDWRDYR